MSKSLTEVELDSKIDYEKSRHDMKLFAILEGDRKKKLQKIADQKK